AVAAHGYDPTTTARILGAGAVWDSGTPNVYAQYWTPGSPSYFNSLRGAVSYINFYNPVDYALDAWTLDQDLKPDTALAYDFDLPTGAFTQYKNSVNLRNLTFQGGNTHEIFSFIIEARCFALGAQAGVQGLFNSQLAVELDPDYGFGSL